MKNPIVLEYSKKHIRKELVISLLYIIYIAISLSAPYLMKYFIDVILPNRQWEQIVYFAIAFISIYLLMSVFAILIKYMLVQLENDIAVDLRNRMYSKVIYQSMDFYKKHQLSGTMERIMRDTNVVHSIWGYLFPNIFSSIIMFGATFVIVCLMNWMIGLLSLLAIGAYIFVFKYYNEKLRALFMNTRKDTDEMGAAVTDAWNGAKEIKIFQMEHLIVRRFARINGLLKKHNTEMEMKEEFSSQFMGLATTLGTLITLCVGGYFVINGKLTVGALIALQGYVAKLYSPAQNIADMSVDYRKYQVNLERMNEILGLDEERVTETSENENLTGSILFDNVHFSYGDNVVLNGFSAQFASKGQIGIVGRSGAGKSTILNLLMGFIRPASGTITWGNTNLEKINLNTLRKNISIASQDTYLFNMSVNDNIKIGNPKAGAEEIQKVVDLLEIDKITDRFPDGRDTIIAEMGKNISGGQLQRISIARALLKKAPVLVLDEATSNVDSQSELIIQNALNEIKKDTLVIVVSHRLSSLKAADCIYVLEDGKMIQEGNFEQLSGTNGIFRELFEEQFIEAGLENTYI